MSRRVIAVIDWRAASLVKGNASFLARAGAAGRVRPREWHAGGAKYRSLTLFEDGTCELQHFSTAAAARRLGGEIVQRAARKVRMGQRG